MRPYAWIPVALLLGLVLGSWGPRSEVRRLRGDLLAARDVSASGGRTTRIEGVTELLGISAAAAAAQTPTSATVNSPERGEAPTGTPLRVSDDTPSNSVVISFGDQEAETPPEAERPTPRNLEEEIERASELWRMRSDIARATFISDAELNEEDAVNFDVLMTAMNLRLANSIEKWVDGIKEGAEPGPEAGIRLARDVTDSLVLTYDEMDRKLPGGWRENLEEPVALTDFIDPAVAVPLAEVEGAVDRSGGWGGRRRRRGPSE